MFNTQLLAPPTQIIVHKKLLKQEITIANELFGCHDSFQNERVSYRPHFVKVAQAGGTNLGYFGCRLFSMPLQSHIALGYCEPLIGLTSNRLHRHHHYKRDRGTRN